MPKTRHDSCFPSFLEPERRWDEALADVVSEPCVQGVSRRSVVDLVEGMGAKGMSKSEVSRVAAVLDAQGRASRERPLGERPMPRARLGALDVKVREDDRVVSRAVLIATGVGDDGEREVLGGSVAEEEVESSWRELLRALVTTERAARHPRRP